MGSACTKPDTETVEADIEQEIKVTNAIHNEDIVNNNPDVEKKLDKIPNGKEIRSYLTSKYQLYQKNCPSV